MFRKKITSFVTILGATMWLAGAGCGDATTENHTANSSSVTEAPHYDGVNYKNRIAENKTDDAEVVPDADDDPYDDGL